MIETIIAWFDRHERDLPWRSTTPWGVLVSEFMLQQTPVNRVLPKWYEWMSRWPTPGDLAASDISEAIRAWDRLGYPRRAQRLHQSACAIVENHDGIVPSTYEDLIALPGIGDYTASAVLCFAYKHSRPVLDTNVRRFYSRIELGTAYPPNSISKAECERAWEWTYESAPQGARWAAASMEFGQIICTAQRPQCSLCPISSHCSWRLANYPEAVISKRSQSWIGSDRQCRGYLLNLLREHDSLKVEILLDSWHHRDQAERCLNSLMADKLVKSDGITASL